MSGRHKPLMHVIFLFPPAISPAFPHRSLLSPSHFKNGIYFCLKNHALSLLIQRVRLHWDSKHTSSLSKLGIWVFFPLQEDICLQTRCDSAWSPPGFPSGRIWRTWTEVIDRRSLTVGKSKQYPDAHPVQSTEPGWRQSWAQCLWITPLDKAFLHKAGSASSSSSPQAPVCPALMLSSCSRHVFSHNKPAQQFCSAPHHFCQIHFAWHLALVPKDVFHTQQASLPFKYSRVKSIFQRHLFVHLLFKVRHSKAWDAKAKVIWATSPLIFCLSSSLTWCALYQKLIAWAWVLGLIFCISYTWSSLKNIFAVSLRRSLAWAQALLLILA